VRVNGAAIMVPYRKSRSFADDLIRARQGAQEADSVGRNPDEADETFRARCEGFSAAGLRQLSQCSDFHWYG
jgi:hypothetical protein